MSRQRVVAWPITESTGHRQTGSGAWGQQPERRTEDEMELLDERGIDSDRVLGSSIQTTGSAAKEVLKLHDEVSEHDDVDPTEVVLDTVASLDVEELEQGSKQLGAEISEITDEISERMSSSETRTGAKEVILDTINRHEQHLHAQSEKVNGNISTEMRFEFDDNRYSVYHERYKMENKIASNAEAVRQVYQAHLKEIAEENGWTN